jgi:hypothetical protein
MRRWSQFRKDHKDMAPYALQPFEEMRSSGRSQRPRLVAILEGSGFSATDVAAALVRAKLLVAKRGQKGGCFYPAK